MDTDPPDPHVFGPPDPLVRGMDPDPSNHAKIVIKNLIPTIL